MITLILLAVSLLLFGGFLLLTMFEAQKGVRLFSAFRSRLDERVSHASFILQHVDMTAFLSQVLKDSFEHFVHFIAHLSLLFVREIERSLAQLVRYLRGRRAAKSNGAPSASPFIETMAYFKHTLRRSRAVPNTPSETPGEEGKIES